MIISKIKESVISNFNNLKTVLIKYRWQRKTKEKETQIQSHIEIQQNKEIIELSIHTKMTESSVFSKYMSLLNEIMAIEDESMKYEYVIRFIKKYTVDTEMILYALIVASS